MSVTFEEQEFRGAFAGGCYRDGMAICVEEPKDFCDADTFVSAHYVRNNPGHPLRYCAGEIENVIIGRCGTNGRCTNIASICDDPSSFSYDPTCTIIRDMSSNELTTYGRCNDRCSWSPDDCTSGETWVANDSKCTADQVAVGACFAGHAFCSVSNLGCENEPFLDYNEVREQIGVNCFLSSIPMPTAPVAPSLPVTPTPPPVRAPTPMPITYFVTKPTTMTSPQSFTQSTKEQMSQGGVIGVAVGGALIAGVIVGLVSFYFNKKSQEQLVQLVDLKYIERPPTTVEATDMSEQELGIDELSFG